MRPHHAPKGYHLPRLFLVAIGLWALTGGGARASEPAPSFELQDALDLKPDAQHGRALFAHCTRCHQNDGNGLNAQRIPMIAGQHYLVLVEQLAHFRAAERSEARMIAFVARHDLKGPQDLVDVAAYIASLPPRTPAPSDPNAHGPGVNAYLRECARCHGMAAEGRNDLRMPRLAGQYASYLQRQFAAMTRGERIKRSWDHESMLKGLSGEEKNAMAQYLQSLTPARGGASSP